ncbi:MAG: DUF1854 domain-containing protein [bacterium]|nr:DUF1854 domain-containing protein [bacterium]MDW8164576.1 DUF1854 domain-containing protein [Candidatus Omnitrophota bacterium]
MNPKKEYLTPENIKIFKGEFNTINVYLVEEEILYKGVFVVSCFPISNPYNFISIFYQKETGEVEEIGIIKDISIFSEEEKKLILETLNKHYFSYEIRRIIDIRWKFGFLLFVVETDKGEKQFYLKWERSRAIEIGKRGKILIDIFEDRYVIPDVQKLTPIEKNLFTRFIYW